MKLIFTILFLLLFTTHPQIRENPLYRVFVLRIEKAIKSSVAKAGLFVYLKTKDEKFPIEICKEYESLEKRSFFNQNRDTRARKTSESGLLKPTPIEYD